MSERKQQILQAAIEIIVNQGYGDLTMRALARVNGIQLGGLQYHFPTWEDMLRALVAYTSEAYRSKFELMTRPTLKPCWPSTRCGAWCKRDLGTTGFALFCRRIWQDGFFRNSTAAQHSGLRSSGNRWVGCVVVV